MGELALLILLGAILMGANARCLSIQTLDDCFYARKAVEMARNGGFFTVTWHGKPTFQNPPLQIWIQAQSFRLLGENDLAARFPSSVMALVMLIAVYAIGVLTVGTEAGLTAVALLLICPYFLNNARRCMMEVPLTLWVTLGVWLFLASKGRRGLLLFLAIPFGGALLTKSLLGFLLPLVLLGSAIDDKDVFRDWRLWGGLLAGLLLGLSWPLVEAFHFGTQAVHQHFFGEILNRSTAGIDVWGMATDYPYYLAAYFEPVLPFGLLGAGYLVFRKRGPALLVLWAVAPILLYSLSSARSGRYIFPIFPALALCGGALLSDAFPGAAFLVRRVLAPIGLLGGAAILWVHPTLLVGQGTAVFKRDEIIQDRVQEGDEITYYGTRYWYYANPILYYTGRYLAPSRASARDTVEAAVDTRSRLLLVDRESLGQIPWDDVRARIIFEGEDYDLVRVRDRDWSP